MIESITNSNFLVVVLSSTFLATVFTSVVNIWIKNTEFKREYYREVIQRRLKAYECITDLINELDKEPLDLKNTHSKFIYDGEVGFKRIRTMLENIYSVRLWINENTFSEIKRIEAIVNQLEISSKNQNGRILGIAKTYDWERQINELTKSINKSIDREILEIYKMKKYKN